MARPIAKRPPLVGTALSTAVTGEWRRREYPAASTADWIGQVAGDPYENPFAPVHGGEINTTTPLFQWTDKGEAYTYRVRVYDEAGALLHASDTDPGQNFLLLPKDKALPIAAEYRWTVESIAGSPAYPESAQRRFYVRADSTAYGVDVPGTNPTLGGRIYDRLLGLNGQTAIARPRFISKDPAVIADMQKAFVTGNFSNPLVLHIEFWIQNTGVLGWENIALPNESTYAPGNSWFSQFMSCAYYSKLRPEGHALGTRARAAAKRLFLAFIAYWDGTTGFKRGYGTVNSVDQTNALTRYDVAGGTDIFCRGHVLLVAMGWDMFKDELTAAEKQRALEILGFRMKAMYDGLYSNRALNKYQYESHGINNIGYLACACLLLADADMSSFPTDYQLATIVPQVIQNLYPVWLKLMRAFSADDGSSHSGMQYDGFDSVANPMLFQTLQMFGIDLMDKPRYYNTAVWRAYMNGRGSRTRSHFGDGAESAPATKAYCALNMRYASSLSNYIYGSMVGNDLFVSGNLFVPQRGTMPAAKQPAMLSRVWPGGGYFASLSSWSDPLATAVYARCSPNGGFNHGHHDQNAPVVYGADRTAGVSRQLLIDSGYYDGGVGYGPMHWRYWQRDSRAHNTLSMDSGGNGQLGTHMYAGRQMGSWGDSSIDLLSRGEPIMWKEGGDYSVFLGEAAGAYTVPGWQLETFQRVLLHFRDDVVITMDYAKSASGPHTFGWDFHTEFAVTYAGGVYTITSGAAKGYVQQLYCNQPIAPPIAWSSGIRQNSSYNYRGWDSVWPSFSGTVASGTTTSATLTGAAMPANGYVGGWITVNGVDRKITSHTADTVFWSGALGTNASGSFTVTEVNAPGGRIAWPAGKDQFHHRISTSVADTEYKAITLVSVNATGLVVGPVVTHTATSMRLMATILGKPRTIVFDFVAKTVVIT